MACLEQMNIRTAKYDPMFDKAFKQVRLLNRSGWTVIVWGCDGSRLLVHGIECDGFGNTGRFRGSIDKTGTLIGEPISHYEL